MQSMATVVEESNNNNNTPKQPIHRYSHCCWCLPISHSDASTSIRISTYEDKWWWGRGVQVLMKFREWSELIAGPKWKTFIRRFNRNRSGKSNLNGPFNYDPLSYSLNFDQGPGQSSQLDVVEEASRDFSSRYAAVPYNV